MPVIKDNTGKINSKDNYRPIALASTLSKVLERILLNRIELYILLMIINLVLKKNMEQTCVYLLWLLKLNNKNIVEF